MKPVTRRQFLATAGAGVAGTAALGGLAGCAATAKGDFMPKAGRRVVVVGGGWGGASAAKYVRLEDPGIEVVLLEPNRQFVSCPFSNLVLSGLRTMDGITFGYDGLRRHGVKVIHEAALAIEPDTRRVRVGLGYLEYDRLVVSPGVEMLLFKEDRRNPADPALGALKALMRTIPDSTYVDLAAYYSSLR